MEQKNNSILVFCADLGSRQVVTNVLEEHKYQAISASSGAETRLKYSNGEYKMLVLDADEKGFNTREFILSVRRKESAKNMKNHIPILLVGKDNTVYQKDFADLDNVKFQQKPFTALEIKKKIKSFSGQENAVKENTRKIKKNEYLITEGAKSNEMFWVLEGSFVITKVNVDEHNVVIGEVHPGELVGEMSFLDELPRSASVKACEDSEVLVIPHKKFNDILDEQPRWFRSLMRTLSQRLRRANEKIASKSVVVDAQESEQ